LASSSGRPSLCRSKALSSGKAHSSSPQRTPYD
jgi:hypothetical protein